MTLNGVIRCSSCNKVSKKLGSKDGVCKLCLRIVGLEKIIEQAKKYYTDPNNPYVPIKLREILEEKP